MKVIALFAILAGLFVIAYFSYSYLDECRKQRHRLLTLGIPATSLPFPSGYISLSHLKDLLYEKEAELTEQSYVTTMEGR